MTGKYKILIVDDDDFLRGIYAEVFRTASFDVLSARDGAEALALVKKDAPEIIFTGIMMPNMTGWQLIQKLREQEATRDIPVIISSHLGRQEDREHSEQLGARAFVVKGKISPKDVVNLVLEILEGQKIIRVAVDPTKMDAKLLYDRIGVSGPLVLELTRKVEGGPNEFVARVVPEGSQKSASGSPSGRNARPKAEFEDILHDLESKL
jgi:two-component system chemotaxis response regulator CheY